MKKNPYLILSGLFVLGIISFVLSDSGLLEGKWKKLACLDTDMDGLVDEFEINIKTDPGKADSDGGGVPDGIELTKQTDPLDPTDDAVAEMTEEDYDDARADKPEDDMSDARADKPEEDMDDARADTPEEDFEDAKVSR